MLYGKQTVEELEQSIHNITSDDKRQCQKQTVEYVLNNSGKHFPDHSAKLHLKLGYPTKNFKGSYHKRFLISLFRRGYQVYFTYKSTSMFWEFKVITSGKLWPAL